MNLRKFDKIIVSKREMEVINFLQTGSNDFWKSYYIYMHRKQNVRNVLTIVTWFNSIIKSLHSKEVFLEIPFVIYAPKAKWSGSYYGYYWANPGINASKANFECFTVQDAVMEERSLRNKVI